METNNPLLEEKAEKNAKTQKILDSIFITWVILLSFITFFLFLLILFIPIPSIPTEENIISDLEESILLTQGWSDTLNSDSERGQDCYFYQSWSIETLIVDELTPIGPTSELSGEFLCDDGFTMALRKKKHTCQQERCIGIEGGTFTNGQVEEFYEPCLDLPPCEQGRAAVVLNASFSNIGNFQPEESICVLSTLEESDTQQGVFTWGTCPSTVELDSNAFLAVETDYAFPENNLPIYLTRIRSPGTDLCLVPGDFVPEGNYYTVKSASCSAQPDGGRSWWLMPAINFIDPITGNISYYYPEQLMKRPIGYDIDDFDWDNANLNDLYEFLDQQYSLQPEVQTITQPLRASNYVFCNYDPNAEPCLLRTYIFSAYIYQ